ncbi:uncharacterized protein LOC104425526 [Eucalyptus grandis]|uniref:uncharacterized protein LOC104425526 n=1 Tax=Eucalyptus grandis TaxID=71139 RepID=UPI00192F038E|nr:uncharacterized protein LOC104425526 [Eucalyptus grandis]
MWNQDLLCLSFSKTLNPLISPLHLPCPNPITSKKTLFLKPEPRLQRPLCLSSPRFSRRSDSPPRRHRRSRDARAFAGRSKKKGGGPSPGRIEGGAEVRRQAKWNARRKSRKLAESLFYRLKKPSKNHADNFSEEELEAIGLGYDRMVRFMEKDDPNLRHPYDWYKYGEFGPYSWRGVVVGDPIRGRFSDEQVTLISEVRDHEEWEKIEQFDMAADFGKRLKEMDKSVGFRYFWVFVRHPKWRVREAPWQQWTLVAEVVLEAGKQRLDKWNLMGRLGNKARKLITQCAAWMRPDIIYVKKPVYQCRFEPQDDFFRLLTPFLDPRTEKDFLFEVKNDDGTVQLCTYFNGLCKILRANPKAFVDDVIKAYEKSSDEKKNECLEFLLTNHPAELLHPYTKEWKAKLEEMELGCDAPDDEDDWSGSRSDNEIVDWIEDDDDDDAEEEEEEEEGDQDDTVMELEDGGDDESGIEDDNTDEEEGEKYWQEEFNKAANNSERMEMLAKRSVEVTTEHYKKQLKEMKDGDETAMRGAKEMKDGDETAMRGAKPKVSPEEWKTIGIGPWRKRIRKSKIPPELFLRAAVRPFTYRNLVKEVVLTRHAILDGDIGTEKPE